jgi:hypothetical protein
MNAKIGVREIRLERAEGPSPLPGPRTVASFEEADAVLREWARTAPEGGGYDKCDFRITYADGDTYEGRYDLTRGMDEGTLARHVQCHVLFYAGLWMPPHLTEARYRNVVARAEVANYRVFAERYDLGAPCITSNIEL